MWLTLKAMPLPVRGIDFYGLDQISMSLSKNDATQSAPHKGRLSAPTFNKLLWKLAIRYNEETVSISQRTLILM